MVEKRLNKLNLIQKSVVAPELIGSMDYEKLIIGWGSTYGPIVEALENLNQDNISFLYFKQVYPLDKSVEKYMDQADKTIIFENNAQGQFADLLKLKTGHLIDKKVLKYNGMPFSVEEVEKYLKEFLEA